MATEELRVYVLKPGQEHWGFDEDGGRHLYVGGQKDNDRLPLERGQFAQLRDKFFAEDQEGQIADAQQKAQDALNELNDLKARLTASGVNVEELLLQGVKPIEKPTPLVGTAEPAPADVVPAPVGSTPDPVNAPPNPDDPAKAPGQNNNEKTDSAAASSQANKKK